MADAPNGPDAVQDLAEDVESTLSTIAPVSATTVNAKGDILAGTANDTVARLAVGSNGQVLTADSAASTGVSWATPATVAAATASVATSESTTSTTYTDLTTPGPAVTVDVGPQGVAVVTITGFVDGRYDENYATSGQWWEGRVSFAVSGANTSAAADTRSMGGHARLVGGTGSVASTNLRTGATFVLTGLTPGSTTFTMKYRRNDFGSNGGTASFSTRQIGVVTF